MTTRTTEDIQKLADFLDTKFRLPGGLRVGWDGIIGLIPGIGDFITNVISCHILIRGASLGAPPSVLLRMGLNLLIDNFLDAIPLVGNIFDFFYPANVKNLRLVQHYLAMPQQTVQRSRWVIWLTVVFICVLIFSTLFAILLLGRWLYKLILVDMAHAS